MINNKLNNKNTSADTSGQKKENKGRKHERRDRQSSEQSMGSIDTGIDSGTGINSDIGINPDTGSIPSPNYSMPPRAWFFTFMCMNIPIAGWIYLLRLAFGKKRNQLRDFAKAYLLYKLVFLVISLVLLGILIYIGLDIADKVLSYMEML